MLLDKIIMEHQHHDVLAQMRLFTASTTGSKFWILTEKYSFFSTRQSSLTRHKCLFYNLFWKERKRNETDRNNFRLWKWETASKVRRAAPEMHYLYDVKL